MSTTNPDAENRGTGDDRRTRETRVDEQLWTDERWRSPLDPLVLLAIAGAFYYSADLPGLGAGVTLAAAWLALPNVAVFAAGWIALVALVPDEAPLVETAVPGLALSGLLLTSVARHRLRDGRVFVVSWAALALVTYGVYALTEAVWIAALALLGVGALGFVSLDFFAASRLSSHDE